MENKTSLHTTGIVVFRLSGGEVYFGEAMFFHMNAKLLVRWSKLDFQWKINDALKINDVYEFTSPFRPGMKIPY